ncbi:MAG: hypothetical protein VX768_21330 [Planctomycetota bacterium]|nr:hypothetical protein [Planctomycetota bacterium]
MKYESLEFSFRGKTLVAEWDNRRIPRSCFTTIFFVGFWVFWTATTAFVTYLLFTAQGPWLVLCIWLIFAYTFVVLMPMTWVVRHTIERVEIDNKQYRHYFINLPWWFPKKWSADEITKITFGCFGEESLPMLNVWRGRKRDMIAYWAQNEFREQLFEKIREHLEEIGSKIPVINIDIEPDVA